MSKQTIRTERLRQLVTADGGPAEFARKRSQPGADKPIDATYISQILNGHRAFGERAAANMEIRAGLPAGYFEQQPPQDQPKTDAIDENEFRRKQLLRLVESLGRGGVTLLAEKLEIDPTYLSRMLSDPTTKQHRAVTGDTVIAISKLYPDWLSQTPQERSTSAKEAPALYAAHDGPLVHAARRIEGSSVSQETLATLTAMLEAAAQAITRNDKATKPKKQGGITLAGSQISFFDTVAKATGGRMPNKNSK